ncbi:adenylosuccinate lyase [Sinomicrobium soli]|uniref:adenylosuccinate lyase n=1 Tax=Sinomicrobium sp. N-1-3-6 TaxID=2219864 RepID=UPI000DCDB330|nr:adenylosuccinate lyase [Sinomicrobium sp. N-1-3-6]RAV27857.1 adenylosuccinate lyase [Sinomicrobium sp. N-1-3-6]
MSNLIYDKLTCVNALRENRKKLSDEVLATPALFPELLAACFSGDPQYAAKAAWVLEFVCIKKPDRILPHIDIFIGGLRSLKADGAKRSCGKICELLCDRYFDRKPNTVKKRLTRQHLNTLAEVCFDWLIADEKVALKAYAMHCLYLLGTRISWIHPQLRPVLEQGYHHHTAAYRSRAKKILRKCPKNIETGE